jgi:hypothetical protein
VLCSRWGLISWVIWVLDLSFNTFLVPDHLVLFLIRNMGGGSAPWSWCWQRWFITTWNDLTDSWSLLFDRWNCISLVSIIFVARDRSCFIPVSLAYVCVTSDSWPLVWAWPACTLHLRYQHLILLRPLIWLQ